MAISQGQLAAVTFDEHFIAPDGNQYRTAFGPIYILKAEDLLGFKPKNSADWFVQVGNGNKMIVLAGCRIHQAMPYGNKPLGLHVWDAR